MLDDNTRKRRAEVLRVYGNSLIHGDGDLGDGLRCLVQADAMEQGNPAAPHSEHFATVWDAFTLRMVEAAAARMPAGMPLIDDWLAELRRAITTKPEARNP